MRFTFITLLFASIRLLASNQASAQELKEVDGIRWFSFSDERANLFDVSGASTIMAFSMGNSTDYDVTLTDNKSRILRLDTSSEEYWELYPAAGESEKEIFGTLNNPKGRKYQGRVYFPFGLKTKNRPNYRWGNNSVNWSAVSLAPTRSGFNVVVVDRRIQHKGLALKADRFLNYTGVLSTKLMGRIGHWDTEVLTSQCYFTHGLQLGTFSLLDLTAKDGDVENWTTNIEGVERSDFYTRLGDRIVIPVADGGRRFVLSIGNKDILRFGGQATRIAYPAGRRSPVGMDSKGKDSGCLVENGKWLATLLTIREDRTSELAVFDTASMTPVCSFPLPGRLSRNGCRIRAAGNLIAVQTDVGEPLWLFESANGQLKRVGRTTPLLETVERSGRWNLSDDGKFIFFVSGEKLGSISLERLLTTNDAATRPKVFGAGFPELKQEEIGFEDLPADPPETLVGILPSNINWNIGSPDDRWLIGNERMIYDTANRQLHAPRIPTPCKAVFSADSSRLLMICNSELQIWDMEGREPQLLVQRKDDNRGVYSTHERLLSPSSTAFVDNSRLLVISETQAAMFGWHDSDFSHVADLDLHGETATVSDDWSRIFVSREDGSLWQYAFNGSTAVGNAKSKLPDYEASSKRHYSFGRNAFVAMNADRILVRGYDLLASWTGTGEKYRGPVEFDLNGQKFHCVSANYKWVAVTKQLDNEIETEVLVLDSSTLQASLKLTIPFGRVAISMIANDGQHLIARPNGGDQSFVFRISAP